MTASTIDWGKRGPAAEVREAAERVLEAIGPDGKQRTAGQIFALIPTGKGPTASLSTVSRALDALRSRGFFEKRKAYPASWWVRVQ